MQGTAFEDDFMVLYVGSCDIVLGIPWLCILRDIKVSFDKLVIEFVYQEKSVKFQGAYPSFKIVEAKALDKVTTENPKFP